MEQREKPQKQSKKSKKQKNKQIEQEEAKQELDEKEDLEDEMEGPMPIESLTEKGIGGGDIKKLQDAGFNTVESILFTAQK